MRPACGPKEGPADRPEPGRPRQARLQATRPHRRRWAAAGRGGSARPNTHDSLALIPLVQVIPAIRSRRGPRRRWPTKLHADKGYDYEHWTWLRRRRITPRIARRGLETSERLGRHRWVIERSLAGLTGYRRLTLRYERCARVFTAFLTLAAALTCYKKLTT